VDDRSRRGGLAAADDDIGILAFEKTVGGVKAEGSVDLELFLAEELVARGLVRKPAVTAGIIPDIVVLVAGEG
jgi:hypothetical protein